MASLGQVCAVGIGWNMVISVYLLPVWWSALAVRPMAGPPAQPSSLYGWPGWQAGMFVVRRLPRGVCAVICKAVGHGYWLVQRRRREVVIQNLLPAVQGNRVAAAGAGRRLTVNFVQKLADLWRLESGAPMLDSFGEWTGWEHFTAAQARGHGVLLATVHLGNWELGGSLMIHKGVRLLVLSQPEPDVRLTELRQAARARLGIDTLIVGADPFAFIEVIKRLDAGATVALLVDRPVTASAVEVELFGQPFHASVAAAELARASGCAVLPVAIVRAGGKYHANILPEIPYDRVTLGDRESRRQFTQEITRAFEPILRQHPDQWYHFVPIWPGAK
ncbi:MAG TPA: lysophospholipid acyltransferase family protein, partial [Verrucomicrobiae bacterium]|jgi:KDO2-lipid IV(A) lauroyltransferase